MKTFCCQSATLHPKALLRCLAVREHLEASAAFHAFSVECRDRSLEFALKGMVELTHLNLRGCWRLSLRTVDELPRLPNLQEINLSMFRNMSYHGLSTLSVSCPFLTLACANLVKSP